MIFQKEIALKDGTPCLLRSGWEEDAAGIGLRFP